MKKLLLKIAVQLIPLLWELIEPMITDLINELVKNMVKSNQQQLSTLMNAIKDKKPVQIGQETIDLFNENKEVQNEIQ